MYRRRPYTAARSYLRARQRDEIAFVVYDGVITFSARVTSATFTRERGFRIRTRGCADNAPEVRPFKYSRSITG